MSVKCRSSIGHVSVESRPSIGHVSVEYQWTKTISVDISVGRLSTDISVDCRPIVSRQLTDISANSRPIYRPRPPIVHMIH